MDVIVLRSVFTVVSFVVFIGILWWAYNGRQNQAFAEAARIPFEEDDDLVPARGAARANESKEYRP